MPEGFNTFTYLGHDHYECKYCGESFCGDDVVWAYHECEGMAKQEQGINTSSEIPEVRQGNMDNRDALIEIKGNLIEDRSLIETSIHNLKHDIKDSKITDRAMLINRVEEIELYVKTLNLRIKELNELSKPTHDDKIVILDYLEKRFKKRQAEGYKNKSVGDTPCAFCVNCWSKDREVQINCDRCKSNNYALWVVDVRNPDFLKVDAEFHQKLNKTYREIDAIDVMLKTNKEFRDTYGDYMHADFYQIVNNSYEERKKQIIEERKNLYKEYCDD